MYHFPCKFFSGQVKPILERKPRSSEGNSKGNIMIILETAGQMFPPFKSFYLENATYKQNRYRAS